jgi:alpha-1,2-mannosyltransferase
MTGTPDTPDAPERPTRRGGFLSFERQLRMTYGLGLGLAVVYAALIIRAASANGTLGYDFLAYDLAIDRLFAGQPLYDATATEFGPFGLFFYPPPFLLLVLPVALLPQELAIWTWTGLLTAASVAGVAVMPIARRTFWWVLLLAALSWPLVYAIKLGQVGPIALLLFAIGWRWLDRPRPLGLSIGLGTVIKIQPALLIGWALVTGRRRAALVALAVVVVLGVIATLLTGPGAWFDLAALLARVSKPIETPHAYGVGRLVFEAGASLEVATLVHWANFALAALVVAITVLRGSVVAGYLAVVVASQFLTPVLWDHYALVLLIPAAWLLDRGRLWAAAIPLATSTPLTLMQVDVPAAYPISFWVTLLALAWEGIRERREIGRSAGST